MLGQRTIKVVRDKDTGEVFEVNGLLGTQKQAFHLRNDIAIGSRSFVCCECEQDLKIAPSIHDRLYFSHYPNSNYCFLKKDQTEGLSDYDLIQYLTLKESPRHKYLKNKIGESLKSVDGVGVDSIQIDNKFIFNGSERRKPDVYCVYKGHELVFEIQLSPLSLVYINERHSFYKSKNIFLMWVLDGDVERFRKQLMRDLKWLNTHQNLFQLNEESASLSFHCEYKQPFINSNNEIWDKWVTKVVGLEDLIFNRITQELYHFDYNKEQKKKEDQLKALMLAEDLKRKELEKEDREKTIDDLIRRIEGRKSSGKNFYYLQEKINGLSIESVNLLNTRLRFENRYRKGLPIVNYYIRHYKDYGHSKDHSFLRFLLSAENIRLSINDQDQDGRGCLQELYENRTIRGQLWYLLPLPFIRGYKLTEFDKHYFLNSPTEVRDPEIEFLKLKYYESAPDGDAIALIRSKLTYLTFVESAVQGKIIGSGLKNWVQYMMGIMSNYRGYWCYTKKALHYNGVWDHIARTDKRGTFQRKISEFKLEAQEPDITISQVLMCLYPEVF